MQESCNVSSLSANWCENYTHKFGISLALFHQGPSEANESQLTWVLGSTGLHLTLLGTLANGHRAISDMTWQKTWGLSRVSSLISKRIVGLGLGVSINVRWSRPRLLNWSAVSIFHGRVPPPQQQQQQQHYCSGRWAVAAEEIMMIITLTLAIDGQCLVTRPAVGAISRVLQFWLWYCYEYTIVGEDICCSALQNRRQTIISD